MAKTRTAKTGRRATRSASSASLPWVGAHQFEAYLEAREALRRAHAAALLTCTQRASPRPSTH